MLTQSTLLGRAPMVFIYCIIPGDGSEKDALVRANLYAPTIEVAKEHVRTVTAPGPAGRHGLQVILRDDRGQLIWQGPYVGSDADT
jgi:hypothetical protein